MQELMLQACERCWGRKQKCDRVKPVCSQCRDASVTCIERRLGTTLDPSNPEAHHSYIESMKIRIANLESRLRDESVISPAPPSYSSATAEHSDRRTSVSQWSPGDNTRRPEPQQTQSHHDTLQTEIGFLSLTAMAGFTGEQNSSTATVSFGKLVQVATNVSGDNLLRSDAQNEVGIGSLGEFHRTLLREGIRLSMVESMEPIHRALQLLKFKLPLLDDKQLLEDYEMVMHAEKAGTVDKIASESPCKLIQVYLAAAIGMLIGKDHRHTETFSTLLILRGYQFMPRIFAQASDPQAAQCLALISAVAIYSPFGGSPWHLLGLAMTRCISGGMHTARVSDHRSDDEARKNCSRVFWAIYTFDATLSISTGRPFGIQDEDISSPEPARPKPTDEVFDLMLAWNIHQAKLLHNIRSEPEKGVLYHFSNYQHWSETCPIASSHENNSKEGFQRYHYATSSCKVLLTIIHSCDTGRSSGFESVVVFDQAAQDFVHYMGAIEAYACAGRCALTSIDGLDVFSVAIAFIWIYYHQAGCGSRRPRLRPGVVDRTVLKQVQKPLQILTAISQLFTSMRGLKDTLEKFVDAVTSDDGVVDFSPSSFGNSESEVPIPSRKLMVQALEMKRKALQDYSDGN